MLIFYISIVSIMWSFIECAPIEILNDNESPLPLPSSTDIDDHTPILILSQTESSSPDGSFSYSFETGNHIKQQVNGYHKTVFVPRIRDDGTKSTDEHDTADVIVQSGSYSYIAPDGTVISINFIADENGFKAFGDALPKLPTPIPDTISHGLLNYSPSDEQVKEIVEEDEEQQQRQTPQFLAAASQGSSPH